MTLTYPTINNVIHASSFFGAPSYLLNAYIDDVFFYNRMLSEAEMATVATYNSVNVAASNTPPQSAFAALQSSLAHYWTFNENYVNVVNGALGSPVGNVSFGDDRFGTANRALSINGGYVLLPTDVYLSGDYSIAFWIRVNQFTSKMQTIIRLMTPDSTNGFYLYMFSTGSLKLFMSNTISNDYMYTFFGFPLNQWLHIGFTMSGYSLSVYANGALRDQKTLSVSMASALHANSMFGDGGLAAQPLYVSLDDMMFFNRALTASEMLLTMSYSLTSVVDLLPTTTTSTSTSTRSLLTYSYLYWNFNDNYLEYTHSSSYVTAYGSWSYDYDRNGRSNSAIRFSGGYLLLLSTIYGHTQTNLKSMVAWVLIRTFSGCQYIFSADATSHYFDWYFCNSGDVFFKTSSSDYFLASIPTTYSWVHLSMVINSDCTTMTSYKNGILIRSSTLVSFADYIYSLYISNPNNPFYGSIDDLTFFGTQLSSSDMLSVMNAYN